MGRNSRDSLLVLDCESAESVFKCLDAAFDVRKEQIIEWFGKIRATRPCADSVDPTEVLRCLEPALHSRTGFEATYWFHLGRTLPSCRFDDGLLPLGECVGRIWDMLYSLLQNYPIDEWDQFRKGMEAEFDRDVPGVRDYRLKTTNRDHWGPYAYLILEAAYGDPGGLREREHYWDAPEVVDNICKAFYHRCGIDLLARFTQCSKPYVVKFIDYSYKRPMLEDALWYLYLCDIDMPEIYMAVSRCFYRRGAGVPNERIASIRYLELE